MPEPRQVFDSGLNGFRMRKTARLIIPVWAETYIKKFLAITLPALLAPGNLPTLCGMFDVEFIIVTETRMFDMIRGARSFQAAEKICNVRLVPLDDLLTSIFTDYGMVLTYALFRGFEDLGPRVTETYLLPFVGDFVISDGSLRHLGTLMQQGKRVIHAPSFRVAAEEVDPQLQAFVDRVSCALSVTPRQMAKLALANKHHTVKARTVNQRLRHLVWMDQYYWYVDDDTLIGYQSPAALVAVKPERFVSEPVGFWDYGFLPEAAPNAEPYLIGDSDDYFMVEPQGRHAGQDGVRLGWTSFDELARTDSLRATKEHRWSSQQLITIHAADLPAGMSGVVEESRNFMAELSRRLSLTPASHANNPVLGQWFKDASRRRRGMQNDLPSQPSDREFPRRATPSGSVAPADVLVSATEALRAFYRRTFGAPPTVSKFHPFWTQASSVRAKAPTKQSGPANVLWLNSSNWQLVANRHNAGGCPSDGQDGYFNKAPYDGCICELSLRDLSEINRIYVAVRPLIRDGGYVLINTVKTGSVFDGAELFLSRCEFPDVDVSKINFHRGVIAVLRTLYLRAMRPVATRPVVRGATICALILSAPFVWLANAWAARPDPSIFRSQWTSLTIEFMVKRRAVASSRASGRPASEAVIA